MPAIKIHPPQQLPEQAVSQQQFEDWTNELEIYLGQDEAMARFMTGGIYANWTSQEEDNHRIELTKEIPIDLKKMQPTVKMSLLSYYLRD